MEKELKKIYLEKGDAIRKRLQDFRNLSSDNYVKEFVFCLLTPQSNAFRCWEAVEEIFKLENKSEENIGEILKTRTRFHNTKAKRVVEGLRNWSNVRAKLSDENIVSLRNWLAENVNGYGLKEAGHFLRNIGKSDGEITILDRHILRNLKNEGLIPDDKIRGRKNYLEIESKFLEYSKKAGISVDELDLLFWSKENGEIFK